MASSSNMAKTKSETRSRLGMMEHLVRIQLSEVKRKAFEESPHYQILSAVYVLEDYVATLQVFLERSKKVVGVPLFVAMKMRLEDVLEEARAIQRASKDAEKRTGEGATPSTAQPPKGSKKRRGPWAPDHPRPDSPRPRSLWPEGPGKKPRKPSPLKGPTGYTQQGTTSPGPGPSTVLGRSTSPVPGPSGLVRPGREASPVSSVGTNSSGEDNDPSLEEVILNYYKSKAGKIVKGKGKGKGKGKNLKNK